MSDSTSVNLLQRLRHCDDQVAWNRFIDLYAPLIFHWVRRTGIQEQDAADLVQDILLTLITKLRDFEYDATMRFRGWLRKVTINQTIDYQRRWKTRLDATVDLGTQVSALATEPDLSDHEYQWLLIHEYLQLIASEFSSSTLEAGKLQLLDGISARETATRLGLSLNAVYLAKSRVLARLRQELDGMLD